MALVKSQGSSHRKGKEPIFDPPAALDVGKEAEYSESEHSDEEEAQRNPDSECALLIDPWYDVHPHFQRFLAIMSHHRWAVCGLPFFGETPTFLGPVDLFGPRSSHSLRHFAPRAYPFQIWVRHRLVLERMGR